MQIVQEDLARKDPGAFRDPEFDQAFEEMFLGRLSTIFTFTFRVLLFSPVRYFFTKNFDSLNFKILISDSRGQIKDRGESDVIVHDGGTLNGDVQYTCDVS